MFITTTLTKKSLEELIKATLKSLGNLEASQLADSLKLMGFYYATSSGISIAISDLKTPKDKKDLFNEIDSDFKEVSISWNSGKISDIERFQSVIDNWQNGAELLKTKIINHFKNHDPLNSLYIMAFSGARGNMAQVKQIIGLRGLVTNQMGDIINLPIKSNFREGLSSIDYIISSYGARKGVVDTALKTADAGYLTRRLVYSAQELLIKEIDCKTPKRLHFVVEPFKKNDSFIGKTITDIVNLDKNYKILSGSFTSDFLQKLIVKKPLFLFYRSPLTCLSINSICQKCYGWNLATNDFIKLGSAIGIIAAQSIGEPGTQLTMRTFHTGGILNDQTHDYTKSPASGKISFMNNVKLSSIRTSKGKLMNFALDNIFGEIISYNGKKNKIFIPKNSLIYIKANSFVKKGQILSEKIYSIDKTNKKTLHPIKTFRDCEITIDDLNIKNIQKQNLNLLTNKTILKIKYGKTYKIPLGASFLASNFLNVKNAYGFTKIASPISGLVFYDKNKQLVIKNGLVRLKLNLKELQGNDFTYEIKPLTKNFQYIDNYTEIAKIFYYPKESEKVYKIKTKIQNFTKFIFYTRESDIWNINFKNPNLFIKNSKIFQIGSSLSSNLKTESSCELIKKDGFSHIYQKIEFLFIPKGSIILSLVNKIIKKNDILGFLVVEKRKNEDIVQGLPKIEEIFESRNAKNPAILNKNPAIFFGNHKIDYKKSFKTRISIINHMIRLELNDSKKRANDNNNYLFFLNGLLKKGLIINFNNRFYFANFIIFSTFAENFLNKYFIKEKNIKLLEKDKEIKKIAFFNYFDNIEYLKTFNLTYDNSTKLNCNNFISFYLKKKGWLNPKEINIYSKIETPLKKLIIKGSSFIDLAQPITEGTIDAKNLLKTLFYYHIKINGLEDAILRSITKVSLILLNSVQTIYGSQGVDISNTHFEVILHELLSKSNVKKGTNTCFLEEEIVSTQILIELIKVLKKYKLFLPIIEPMLLPISKSVIKKGGFLAAAGFQETRFVLTKAAIEGTKDWLQGLEDSILIGRLGPNENNVNNNLLNYKVLYKDNN